MGSTYERWQPKLRFGVASSAYQTEGGLSGNNWAEWERRRRPNGEPTILNGDRCGGANDSWERFDEELASLVWLGVDVYRFSVEWSRVEPLRGHFDEVAVDRYRDWCVRLRTVGIEPIVTLHHFTEPTWFCEAGGFSSKDTTAEWLRFVEQMALRLGDVVNQWITVNEPVGYVVQGWIRGVWPPGRAEPRTAARILEHLLLAHAEAYQLIHRVAAARDADSARTCQVGMAHHIVVFRPRRPGNPLDRWAARSIDQTYNHAVLGALETGHLKLWLPGLKYRAHHRELIGTQDFIGLNHYHLLYASVRLLSGTRLSALQLEGSRSGEKDDLGFDVDPRSLAVAAQAVQRYGLPIHITEHGTCDAANPDNQRCRQLAGTLHAVEEIVANGVDVRSYLHWTLADNFEWAYGFSAHFGLFRVDRETFARTPTAAAFLYRDLIAHHHSGSPQGPEGTGKG
jgi:beta-glucosidase